jgi:hypothetical protein
MSEMEVIGKVAKDFAAAFFDFIEWAFDKVFAPKGKN